MAQIIDSIVKISINEAISTVSTTSVNTLALVGPASSEAENPPDFIECSSAEDAEVFGTNSLLYGMVESAFAQDACPAKIVAINADSFSDALDAVKAAEAAKLNFYHIVAKFGDDTIPAASAFTGNGGWNGYLGANFKIVHLELNDTSTDFASIRALAQALVASTSDRVALYQHAGAGNLAAALVSNRCALDSARGSFAHKKVKGVEYDSYTKSQYDALVSDCINVYTVAAGEARLFMGATAGKTVLLDSTGEQSPASFIDNIAKDDWIRFNVQTKIYSLRRIHPPGILQGRRYRPPVHNGRLHGQGADLRLPQDKLQRGRAGPKPAACQGTLLAHELHQHRKERRTDGHSLGG